MNPLKAKGKAQATPTCGPPAMVTPQSALWPAATPQQRSVTIGSHILVETEEKCIFQKDLHRLVHQDLLYRDRLKSWYVVW